MASFSFFGKSHNTNIAPGDDIKSAAWKELPQSELVAKLKNIMINDTELAKKNPNLIIDMAKKLLLSPEYAVYQTAITVLKQLSVINATATSILQNEFQKFDLQYQGSYSNITPRNFESRPQQNLDGPTHTRIPVPAPGG